MVQRKELDLLLFFIRGITATAAAKPEHRCSVTSRPASGSGRCENNSERLPTAQWTKSSRDQRPTQRVRRLQRKFFKSLEPRRDQHSRRSYGQQPRYFLWTL